LFLDIDAKINEWNSRPDVTHKLAHNKFSDWTEFERKRLTGFNGPKEAENEVALNATDLPDSVNWVTKGAVNAI